MLGHRVRSLRAVAVVLPLAVAGALTPLIASPAQAHQIAQSQLVSAAPAAWTPNILNGKVSAIVQVGNKMIAAGTFTQAQNATGGQTYTRNRILAFNATTGVIDTGFVANVNAEISGMVVAPEGNAVIIGGTFTNVNGTAVQRLVKLDTNTGAIVPGFSAKVTGRLNDVDL